MGIKPMFNDVEFFELIWMYERMGEQRQKENESQEKAQGNRMSLEDVLGGRSA